MSQKGSHPSSVTRLSRYIDKHLMHLTTNHSFFQFTPHNIHTPNIWLDAFPCLRCCIQRHSCRPCRPAQWFLIYSRKLGPTRTNWDQLGPTFVLYPSSFMFFIQLPFTDYRWRAMGGLQAVHEVAVVGTIHCCTFDEAPRGRTGTSAAD
jgi:hypothetical protein